MSYLSLHIYTCCMICSASNSHTTHTPHHESQPGSLSQKVGKRLEVLSHEIAKLKIYNGMHVHALRAINRNPRGWESNPGRLASAR
jgi:hypothetical protein